MQTIRSITRLTSDPDGAAEVMLDYGESTVGEPALPTAQEIQSARYPGGRGVDYFPRGNNDVQISWSRIFKFATPHQARAFGSASRANTPWERKAPLDEEWGDGSRVRTHDVVIESVEAEYRTEGDKHWCILRYDAVGGTTTVEASGGFSASHISGLSENIENMSGPIGAASTI